MLQSRKSFKTICIALVILALFSASPTLAATITVTNLNDSGPGSLRDAIAAASPGDTIVFSVTGTITLTRGELLISKNLTIKGPGASSLAISGNNSSRVFEIASGVTAAITGLTIQNTGARANEAAQTTIADLQFAVAPRTGLSSVMIRGKGNKLRRCPLWSKTVSVLLPLVDGRPPTDFAFLNRCGRPITRFGIHGLVERYAARVSARLPAVRAKRVSPHTIRHTTATHLLHAGVDINTIRAWLGHVSLNTTNIYAEIDLETKARALALCEVKHTTHAKPWHRDKGLVAFLRAL
jgi:hypothetical protein